MLPLVPTLLLLDPHGIRSDLFAILRSLPRPLIAVVSARQPSTIREDMTMRADAPRDRQPPGDHRQARGMADLNETVLPSVWTLARRALAQGPAPSVDALIERLTPTGLLRRTGDGADGEPPRRTVTCARCSRSGSSRRRTTAAVSLADPDCEESEFRFRVASGPAADPRQRRSVARPRRHGPPGVPPRGRRCVDATPRRAVRHRRLASRVGRAGPPVRSRPPTAARHRPVQHARAPRELAGHRGAHRSGHGARSNGDGSRGTSFAAGWRRLLGAGFPGANRDGVPLDAPRPRRARGRGAHAQRPRRQRARPVASPKVSRWRSSASPSKAPSNSCPATTRSHASCCRSPANRSAASPG